MFSALSHSFLYERDLGNWILNQVWDDVKIRLALQRGQITA